MIPDRSSPSRVHFAASHPGPLRADPGTPLFIRERGEVWPSKPGNHGAKLGYFLLAFRVLVEAAHPDLADAVTVHPVCSWFLLAQLWQEQDQGV